MINQELHQPVILSIRLTNGSSAFGEAKIESIPFSERFSKFLLTFFVGLIVTAFSILIPILHFILVPLFAIITLIASALVSGAKERITSAYGTCPACKKQFQILPRAPRFPFKDVCDHCHRSVIVDLKTEKVAS